MRQVLDPKCPFCDKSTRDAVFAEHSDFFAIYNIAPVVPGHSLIIPRWHVRSLLELSDHESAEMIRFSRVAIRNLLRIFKADGFDLTVQEGASAGQTIPHLHLHLIPRSEGDLGSPGDWYPALRTSEAQAIDSEDRPKLTLEQRRTVTDHIRSEWLA